VKFNKNFKFARPTVFEEPFAALLDCHLLPLPVPPITHSSY